MKYLFLIILLINSITTQFYKGIKSDCTKKVAKENIDGTFACLREEPDVYVPYFGLKNYTIAIKDNDCETAKALYKKYQTDKRFVECHKRWNVFLID